MKTARDLPKRIMVRYLKMRNVMTKESRGGREMDECIGCGCKLVEARIEEMICADCEALVAECMDAIGVDLYHISCERKSK